MLQNIVEAAAALGHRARSNLAGLWNSSIRYAQVQNIAKLYEKLGAIYELLKPDPRDKEQVVADEGTEDGSQEQVVAAVHEVTNDKNVDKADENDEKTDGSSIKLPVEKDLREHW